MTISSFTSLTLDPTPLVTFNIATPSRTLDAVAASRKFNIHVLSDDVDGARAADWFTRGNEGGVLSGVEECGLGTTTQSGGGGTDDAPLLKGEGVMYILKCKLLDDEPAHGLLTIRDHAIVVGEVGEIVDLTEGGHGGGSFALLYADRRYRQLGNMLTKES